MRYDFAPLEGMTNRLYRQTHRAFFPTLDRYFTPFYSSGETGLAPKDVRLLQEEHDSGVPLVPQLLGNRSAFLLTALEQLTRAGFSEVNLNLACPSGTVCSKQRGAGALRDLAQLRSLLTELYENTPCHLSIKTRLGFHDLAEWDGILALYNDFPLHELILHPRLRDEQYQGKAHRAMFAQSLECSRAPLIYSGDVFTPADVKGFVETYPKSAGLMLGRGLIANPALHAMATQNASFSAEALFAFHTALLEGYRATLFGEKPVLHKLKELWFYMIWLFQEHDKYAKQLRKAPNLQVFHQVVAQLCQELPFDPQQGFHPPQKNK